MTKEQKQLCIDHGRHKHDTIPNLACPACRKFVFKSNN